MPEESSIFSLLQNKSLSTWELLEILDHHLIKPLLDFVQNNVNLTDLTNYTNFLTSSSNLEIFDEFQWKLCKILGFIVVTNLTLIYFFWKRMYGNKIIDKFMQPSSSTKLIEELKLSISELKLPQTEYSPRL